MTCRLVILLALASLTSATLDCYCGIENLRHKRNIGNDNLPSNASATNLTVQPRIFNGDLVKRNNYPWMASVLTKHWSSEEGVWKQYTCGGTIINNRYILTAAHCLMSPTPVSPDNVEVILGAHTIAERYGRGGNFSRVAAKSLKIHPGAGGSIIELWTKVWNDIALIELKEPLQFSSSLKPICLPYSDHHERLFSIGWGLVDEYDRAREPDELQEIYVYEVDPNQCKIRGIYHPDKQICAGSGGGVCSGDSGGPMATRIKGRVYQVGVTSLGRVKCIPTVFRPDSYVRVTGHLDWIREQTNNAQWCESQSPIY